MDIFGLGTLGSSLMNNITNGIISAQNYKQQEKWMKQQQENWNTQFEYTKWLNDMQMKREDTAVQRAKTDYEAAGFNKLLAVGQPAQAGTLTNFTGNAGGSAPQIDYKSESPIEAYLEARQMMANTQLTEEQAKLTREKTNSESALTGVRNIMKDYYEQLTARTKNEAINKAVDFIRNWRDYQVDLKLGTKSNEVYQVNNPWSLAWVSYRHLLMRNGVSINDIVDYLKEMRDEETAKFFKENYGIETPDKNGFGTEPELNFSSPSRSGIR